MTFGVSESLGDKLLNDIIKEVPTRNEIRYRKESFGYTVFDVKSLKTILIDKIGFSILYNIDGERNIKSIMNFVSNDTKIPYHKVAAISTRYLSLLSDSNLIEINGSFLYKHNKKHVNHPILNGPNEVSWLITNQCNLRCMHCGNTSRAKLENEMSKDECFDFIDQCAELNVFVLNISGGEPFLKENLFEILSYARKKNIEVGITTNGTLIDNEIIHDIKKIDPFNVHVSLDGIGKVHDDFRNEAGVFNLVENCIKLFQKNKISFGITTSITKKNFHDLDNVKDYIKKNKELV
jgi:sulfatase maturation enzyme AslB (radical SAM superfamily)